MSEPKVYGGQEVVAATASGAGPKHRSLRGDVWRQFRRHKGALAGLFVFFFVALASFVGPYLMPYDAVEIDVKLRNLGPSWSHLGPIHGAEYESNKSPCGPMHACWIHVGQIWAMQGFTKLILAQYG